MVLSAAGNGLTVTPNVALTLE
jgi:hypothetical protein